MAPQLRVSGHALPEEECVDEAENHWMQPPGSIFGLFGTKTRLTPFPIWTETVRGVACSRHSAGTSPTAQVGVTQAVCASPARGRQKAVSAETTIPRRRKPIAGAPPALFIPSAGRAR